jgi:hypothetical protein
MSSDARASPSTSKRSWKIAATRAAHEQARRPGGQQPRRQHRKEKGNSADHMTASRRGKRKGSRIASRTTARRGRRRAAVLITGRDQAERFV